MWVCLSNAFLSIVQPSKLDADPEQFLLVRARRPGDIERVRRFARANGLHVVRAHQGRRIVELGGTVAAMSRAFGVDLADPVAVHDRLAPQNRIFELVRVEEFGEREGLATEPLRALVIRQ